MTFMTKQTGRIPGLVLGVTVGAAIVVLSLLLYIPNGNASSSNNVIASANVGYLCDITLSNTAVTLVGTGAAGAINPGSNVITANLVVDTNTNGNLNGNLIISANGIWYQASNPANTMLAGQTLWNPTSLSSAAGNALTTSNTDTKISVNIGASNDIFFGLSAVPLDTGAGIYTQNVVIYNSCPSPLTNSIVKTLVFTANIAGSCGTLLSNTAITFSGTTGIAPGSNVDTANLVVDTNLGSSTTNIIVYGSNWVVNSGTANFFVTNTDWNPTSLGSFAGNGLLQSPGTVTDITIAGNTGTAVSNNIYFGLQIPGGTLAGIYTQNIAIENSC